MPKILILLMAALLCLSADRDLLAAEKEARNAALLSPLEAYDLLMRKPETAFIVDVRSRQEYAWLGHPAGAYNIPWRFSGQDLQISAGQTGSPPQAGYQLTAEPNPDFIGVASSLFKETDHLLIICTDGQQSAQASDALWAAGFKNTAQIKGGVWGEKFSSRDQPRLAEKYSGNYGKPGLINGWAYWGLPMSYQLDPRYLYPPDVKRAQSGN